MRKLTTLSLATALLGAVSLAATVVPPQAADGVKCYGIAKAGENDCANAAATHSCAGQSTADYSGQDWKAVASADECTASHGQLEAFEGVNVLMKKSG